MKDEKVDSIDEAPAVNDGKDELKKAIIAGLSETERVIQENNCSSGGAGLCQGYIAKIYRDLIKNEKGRGRPKKGEPTASDRFYAHILKTLNLGKSTINRRIQLWDKMELDDDFKPVMDEIVKIRYEALNVDRKMVDNVVSMLSKIYGDNSTLTNLYREYDILPKLVVEEDSGKDKKLGKKKLQTPFEKFLKELKKIKIKAEENLRGQDDPKVIRLLDWLNSFPIFEEAPSNRATPPPLTLHVTKHVNEEKEQLLAA